MRIADCLLQGMAIASICHIMVTFIRASVSGNLSYFHSRGVDSCPHENEAGCFVVII